MLDAIPFVIGIGAILGFLSGLGIGGGSLLMLWLTAIVGLEQGVARAINLMFFLPSALICCLFRWKQGRLSWETALPAAIAGCLAAGLCSWLGGRMDTGLLRKIFGVLLLFTGCREIFYRPRKDK